MSFLSTDDCASSHEGLQVKETSLQDEVVSGRSMKHDILGIFTSCGHVIRDFESEAKTR